MIRRSLKTLPLLWAVMLWPSRANESEPIARVRDLLERSRFVEFTEPEIAGAREWLPEDGRVTPCSA